VRMWREHRGKGFAALAAAAVLAAAAGCGSDSGDGAASSGSSGTSGGKGPINLAFLWEVKGESSYAIQDFQEGAQIAVDKLNADGGVDGRKVEYKRYPASPTDASQSISQFLKAVQGKPAVTLGPPGPIQQVYKKNVDRAKVANLPVSPDAQSEMGQKFGSEYRFFVGASGADQARAAAWFVTTKLGAKKIGLLSSPDPSDSAMVKVLKEEVPKHGAQITEERQFPIDATDVTKETLAMKGVDAVLLFSYENPSSLAINQLAQQGINVPVVTYSSIYPAVAEKLVHPEAMKNVYANTPCNLYGDDVSPQVKEFATAYEAATKTPPSFQAATAYDSVLVAAEAAAKAGSDDPAKVTEAIKTGTFTGGVCGDHKADERHIMSHKIYIHDFKSGKAALTAEYDPSTDKQ
jgi:branched-chain amino acid transport system substrate-binding protein